MLSISANSTTPAPLPLPANANSGARFSKVPKTFQEKLFYVRDVCIKDSNLLALKAVQ